MTVYKKPDDCSVPFYHCVFQAFYSFGSYMEAFKCINHDDKQTCNVICHLFSREFGKKHVFRTVLLLISGSCKLLEDKLGVPLQRLLTVFKL